MSGTLMRNYEDFFVLLININLRIWQSTLFYWQDDRYRTRMISRYFKCICIQTEVQLKKLKLNNLTNPFHSSLVLSVHARGVLSQIIVVHVHFHPFRE